MGDEIIKPEKEIEEAIITIQMQPIEFNIFVGHKPPSREEIARAYIQLFEDNNFWYQEIIKHTNEGSTND